MKIFNLPALTMFLGSFLIFGVQPMLGRTLLPAFGGTAAVWVVCLASFQLLLLVGYFYAHCVGKVKSEKRKVKSGALHIALLGLAVVWVVGFAMGRPWLMAHIGGGAYPALEVLLCVLAFVGLPYVLLSANSTLIQAWVSQGLEPQTESLNYKSKITNLKSDDVYHLYAISNAGSLVGLLCYPFLVEPFLSLDAQWYGFAGVLAVYAGLLAILARRLEPQNPQKTQNKEDIQHPTLNIEHRTSNKEIAESDSCGSCHSDAKEIGAHVLLWLALPATSTFLLNAVTAHLSTDVTPIPLLWVALLAAFLVSYIIGFSKAGEKGVLVWCVVAMIPLAFCAYATGLKGGQGFLMNLIPGLLLVLLGSTFLHSWLYKLRPAQQALTRYYLCLAAGGAIGGLLSGILLPLMTNRILEYPLILIILSFWTLYFVYKNCPVDFQWLKIASQLVVCAVVLYSFKGYFTEEPGVKEVVSRARNFYGCLRVSVTEAKTQFNDIIPGMQLNHGDTMHGLQFKPHYLRDKPTSYYGPLGGGFALLSHPSYTNDTPMRVGLIGLGAGTMACWGRTNDTYRFFEINPKVVDIASNTNYFTYLADSKATVSIGLGDARALIAAETNRYDVLVIDAYSGDAIPFHLATKEAFRLYLDRLNPGGILAVHISNWHIDLNPLCKAVAKEQWQSAVAVGSEEEKSSKVEEKQPTSYSCGSCYSDAKRNGYSSGLKLTGVISAPQGLCTAANWVFISDHELPVKGLAIRETDWTQVRDMVLPTDERGSLISLVRYGHRPPEKTLEIDVGSVLGR
jgi:bacterioferritin-associated ferredoxin